MAKNWKNIFSKILQKIGRFIPNIPKLRAFGNIFLWPLHKALNLGEGITDVLGVKMYLDPSECVDRNLWFSPQLYDRKEIRLAIESFASNSGSGGENIFIDAGANIGFWSLQLANKLPDVRVIAVEANPKTANILEDNVSINRLENIQVVRKGLGGVAGQFKLSCGTHGNRGGDSFKFRHNNGTDVMVDVITLEMLCSLYEIKEIRFIKMDIEGMEAEVLQEFFCNAPVQLYPKFICLECIHDDRIDGLMKFHGYKLVKAYRENSIYSIQ